MKTRKSRGKSSASPARSKARPTTRDEARAKVRATARMKKRNRGPARTSIGPARKAPVRKAASRKAMPVKTSAGKTGRKTSSSGTRLRAPVRKKSAGAKAALRKAAPAAARRSKGSGRNGARSPQGKGTPRPKTNGAKTRASSKAARNHSKHSSPRRSSARGGSGRGGATAVLAAPPVAAPPLVTPPVMHGGPARVEPQFPQDDYDYKYLNDFLDLSNAPRHCRGVIFGCGKGEEAVYLCERGYRITGLDSDRNAVGLARERAWLNDCDVDFMIGDVFETSALLPAESFGLATDRSVFQAIRGERERRRYLEAVRRLLLPGGVFLLSATRVTLPRRAPKNRRTNRQSALLVQEGGEVVGEVIRANLNVIGRHLYPLENGDAGSAELILYCRK